ncbi:MAG TPA: YdeI/OmpD-associated family protein [Dehalococcoidia bacterium]
MELGETFHPKTRAQWRRWLERNHQKQSEIWLVYYTKASGVPFVAYNDAVEEALCFGWIDSLIKKHGPESRAQRFTPRRAKSPMSELNRERVRRLLELGLMTEAGLAVAGDLDAKFKVPPDILRALKKDPEVWKNFQAFPESYKRIRIGWIHNSRRTASEVYEQRLDYFVRMTKQNKRFGTMS